MSNTCANLTVDTIPSFCVEVPAYACVNSLPEACLSVTVLSGSASITLDQFKVLMAQYNTFLLSQTRYANEEDAALDGKSAGSEWLWADDTDVGISGDKHIQRT